jgi:dolichyl-phosphate-mannose--protein O-mannosyl transferase
MRISNLTASDKPRRRGLAAVLFAAMSMLLASVLIVKADLAYNQTFDEGAHVACGMEWLTHGTYTYETLHPPLARIATAILPYLFGARSQDRAHMAEEGTALFNLHGAYAHNLLLSRLGMLPFFWLACLLIFLFMRSHFSPWHGTIAVFLLSFCPVALSNSALATTDAPLMATFLAAVLSFSLYLNRPTLLYGLLAGACVGLACVTKFSAMPFFLLSAAVLIVHRIVRHRQVLKPLRQILLVGLLTIPVFWAAYRFPSRPCSPRRTPTKKPRKSLMRCRLANATC